MTTDVLKFRSKSYCEGFKIYWEDFKMCIPLEVVVVVRTLAYNGVSGNLRYGILLCLLNFHHFRC
jgi:hypothetical protein